MPDIKEMDYESAFKALQDVVAQLENQEQSLEEAMRLFEEGQRLARYCAELLEKAELKVQTLLAEQPTDTPPEE